MNVMLGYQINYFASMDVCKAVTQFFMIWMKNYLCLIIKQWKKIKLYSIMVYQGSTPTFSGGCPSLWIWSHLRYFQFIIANFVLNIWLPWPCFFAPGSQTTTNVVPCVCQHLIYLLAESAVLLDLKHKSCISCSAMQVFTGERNSFFSWCSTCMTVNALWCIASSCQWLYLNCTQLHVSADQGLALHGK